MAVPTRLVLVPAAFADESRALVAAGLEVLVDCTADSGDVPAGAYMAYQALPSMS